MQKSTDILLNTVKMHENYLLNVYKIFQTKNGQKWSKKGGYQKCPILKKGQKW